MKNFETKFTGWAFITSAILLLGGWLLSPHKLQEYIVFSDFEAINQNFWYWIWMFRAYIFGWVIMAISIIALALLFLKNSARILILPAAGIIVAGTFTIALAVAFYYSFGAWGIGQTAGKSQVEVEVFMESIAGINQYVSCLLRFGRVFSGAGFVLLGFGILKSKILSNWIAFFSIIMGFAAMIIIMFFHYDNFELYKPLFYVKVLWLALVGVTILKKGINE